MSNTPQINVPIGYEAVELDGEIVVRKVHEAILNKSISFRVTTEEYNQLQPLREAFPDRTWSTAFRSLLKDPDVTARIKAIVQAAMRPAS